MGLKTATLTITATLTAAVVENRFLGFDGDYASAAGNSLGTTNTDGDIGDNIAVDVLGVVTVEASAAIAVGADIEVAADGKAVTQTSGIIVARALTAAAADGDKIEVLLISN